MPPSHPVKKFIKTPLGINITGSTVGTVVGTFAVLGIVAVWTHASGLWGKRPMAAAPILVVKVKSSIEEFRASSTASAPAFLTHKIAALPNSFRGTLTYKQGLISGAGKKATQTTLFYEMSITSFPALASDKKLATVSAPRRRRLYRRYNHGNQLYQNGDSKGAATEFRFIIDAEPNFAEAHNNYAAALLKQGDFQEAEEQWKDALRLDPTNALYNSNLVKAEIETGLVVIPSNLMRESSSDADLPEGTLMIFNRVHGPLYNLVVRDALVGFSPPAIYLEPSHDHAGAFGMIGERFAGICFSKVGDMLPYGTTTTRDLELQVTYSDPLGGSHLKVFVYVPRQDLNGHWRWYPCLDDALNAALQQEALTMPVQTSLPIPVPGSTKEQPPQAPAH